MATKRKCNNCSMKNLYAKIEILEEALRLVCQEYGDKEEKSQAMIDAMPYWYIKLAEEKK